MGAESPVLIQEPEVPSPPSVSALLQQARAQERLRVILANGRQGEQPNPDYLGATASAQIALDLRQQAHALDPDHLDPSWGEDTLGHVEQCAWLAAYVSRP